ncbi:MAG: hypothetical protein AB1634_16390 [Thermodesulfobacteriota bacterium]
MPPQPASRSDHAFWDRRRGRILARKGGWVVGEAVYSHGYSLLEDLAGRASYMQVLVLHGTGRLPERRLADWLEALFVCMSYPDARIWCNQMGSLAGTMAAGPAAGLCAGILASDSRLYGPGTQAAGVAFITAAVQERQQGVSAKEIVARQPVRIPGGPPVLPGYVRPVASGDERIAAMERVTADLGFPRGAHLSLAFEIEAVMLERFGEGMNLLGYTTAFLCDQGWSAQEQYRVLSPMVAAGVLACYVEAADDPPGAFFPLRCEDIDYQGPAPRPVSDRS